MPIVDFSKFPYYPALTSSDAERIAFERLCAKDKQSILPIFELSYRRNANSVAEASQVIRSATDGRPFILDLNQSPAPGPILSRSPSAEDMVKYDERVEFQKAYNADITRLLNPADGFSAWRELASAIPNVVPMIVYTDAATQHKNILKQAASFSRQNTSIAIRMTPDSYLALMPVVSQILSILESEDRLLIILDCGQVRQRARRVRAVEFVQEATAKILNEIDISHQSMAKIVCMSNSFPHLDHDKMKKFESHDWEIWRTARETCPLMFGDYGAQYRRAPTAYIPAGRSTVVFPLDERWLAYREVNTGDPAGWITGSAEVISNDLYDKDISAWGHDLIKAAAQGNISGVDSARYWHAAKINLHIHRQIHLAATNISDYGDDPDD